MKTRHSRNRHGEPVWTIELTGWHEIIRFANNLLYHQTEFMTIGQKALSWSRRSLGAKRFETVITPYYGDSGKWRDAVVRASKARTGDAS